MEDYTQAHQRVLGAKPSSTCAWVPAWTQNTHMSGCPAAIRVSELDVQLRFTNTAEAHKGHASSRLGTSLVDLVKNASTVSEIGIAGEGDVRKQGRLRFRSF